MVVSSFAIGALATPVFDLGFADTILTILFFNILGILPVSFFSTFGPVFGLRQMVLSRFYFGYYGVKIGVLLESHFHLLYLLIRIVYIVAVLNVLACIGWSSVNTIVGGECC